MLKNTSQMEKLNLDQFNLIQQQKTVINHESNLENAFQEVLYRNDNWINEGSGWIFEFIASQYITLFVLINAGLMFAGIMFANFL